MEDAGRAWRHDGILAVHLRVDGRAKGSDAQPRQSGSQLRTDRPRLRAHAFRQWSVLVTQLPRYGADWRDTPAVVRGTPEHSDVADDVPTEASSKWGVVKETSARTWPFTTQHKIAESGI